MNATLFRRRSFLEGYVRFGKYPVDLNQVWAYEVEFTATKFP